MSTRSTRSAAVKARKINRLLCDTIENIDTSAVAQDVDNELLTEMEDNESGNEDTSWDDNEVNWGSTPKPTELVKKPSANAQDNERPYIPGSPIPAGKKVKSANLARVEQQIRILRAEREKSTDPNFVARYKSIKSAYQRDKAAYIKFKNKYLDAKEKFLASEEKYQKVQAEARANGMLSALKSFSTGQPVIVDIESDSDTE